MDFTMELKESAMMDIRDLWTQSEQVLRQECQIQTETILGEIDANQADGQKDGSHE